jgi:hypothetical protein
VTGDIVQGVPLDGGDAEQALEQQYREAEDFLTSLADRFLKGDRSRVVVLPGNHDVSLPRALSALERVGPEEPHSPHELASQMMEPTSDLRWSWKDLAFFIVRDRSLYDSRLQHFADFYSRFYSGQRRYSTDPAQQCDFFDYPEFGITVVAFSSCYNNDPFNLQGYIHPDCIAAVGNELRNIRFHGRLLVAAYHHSTSGPPLRTDYMDADVLQNLLDCGFTLALHGHQHRQDIVDHRFALDPEQRLTMVAAGTLCGGPGALASGQRRGYNVIEINPTTCRCVIHPRRMHNDTFAAPIWGPDRGPLYPEGNATVKLWKHARVAKAQIRDLLSEGEELLRARRYDEVIAKLGPVASTESLARPFLLVALGHAGDDELTVSLLYPPRSVAEGILLAAALWSLQHLEQLGEMLRMPMFVNSDDPAARIVRDKYTPRLRVPND